MSKDDDPNAPEAEIEATKKKRVVRVVKRVVKKKRESDGPDAAAPDPLEEKVSSAVGPSDAVENNVEKPKERTRRHSKKDKPVVNSDTLDSPSDAAPKVRRVKRIVNVEPALSEWAKKHQSAFVQAKLDQNSPFVASADMVSLSDEMVAIKELMAKADRSSDLITPAETDALANEARIVQEKYEAAKDVHFRNIGDKQKEAEVAFQDVVAADEVLSNKMGLLNEAKRKLDNIGFEISEKREAEQQLIEEIDTAQKELARVREEVKQGIAGEVDFRKKSNVVDEEELVKIKARLDEAKKRTSDISKTLGERLQQKAASKEELSDLQAQPKEEQTTGFLSRAAAKVKELTTSAKTTAANLEVAARDKL